MPIWLSRKLKKTTSHFFFQFSLFDSVMIKVCKNKVVLQGCLKYSSLTTKPFQSQQNALFKCNVCYFGNEYTDFTIYLKHSIVEIQYIIFNA